LRFTQRRCRGGLIGGKIGGPIGGKIGGKRRAENMTPEERSASAKKASLARWAKARAKKRK